MLLSSHYAQIVGCREISFSLRSLGKLPFIYFSYLESECSYSSKRGSTFSTMLETQNLYPLLLFFKVLDITGFISMNFHKWKYLVFTVVFSTDMNEGTSSLSLICLHYIFGWVVFLGKIFSSKLTPSVIIKILIKLKYFLNFVCFFFSSSVNIPLEPPPLTSHFRCAMIFTQVIITRKGERWNSITSIFIIWKAIY